MVLGIFPFLLSYLICWCIIVCNCPLSFLYFCGINCNVFSFIFVYIYLIIFSSYSKFCQFGLSLQKNHLLISLIFFIDFLVSHSFLFWSLLFFPTKFGLILLLFFLVPWGTKLDCLFEMRSPPLFFLNNISVYHYTRPSKNCFC